MRPVSGRCPMGCGDTLIVAPHGSIICSLIGCPRPSAATEVLTLPSEHYVHLDEVTFTVEHPLRERVTGTLHLCSLAEWLYDFEEPPEPPGRYLAVPGDNGAWVLTPDE